MNDSLLSLDSILMTHRIRWKDLSIWDQTYNNQVKGLPSGILKDY